MKQVGTFRQQLRGDYKMKLVRKFGSEEWLVVDYKTHKILFQGSYSDCCAFKRGEI